MNRVDAKNMEDFDFDFNFDEATDGPSWRERKGITFFVDPDVWERYMAAQSRTKRKFGKKVKELVLLAIEKAEPKKGDKAG